MAGKKKNLESSGCPAPKSSAKPKVYPAEATIRTPDGSSISRVFSYDDFCKGTRTNMRVEGFWFDQDTFENLIDDWADYEDLLIILQVSEQQLDVFCNALYGDNYANTFYRLRAISKVIARKAIDKLAKNGNSTAVAIAKTHFAKLIDDDGEKPINITIKNDLK